LQKDVDLSINDLISQEVLTGKVAVEVKNALEENKGLVCLRGDVLMRC